MSTSAASDDGARRPRILHAPADVGGNAFGLSRAERALGLHSDVAVLVGGPYGYGADIRVDLGERRGWRTLAARTRLLLHAMRSYDCIHFNFGQSLLPIWLYGRVLSELPLLERAGKKILVTFQGCDVRPRACCFCQREQCRADDRYRAPNAAHFLRHVDRCFHLNPDLSTWLPGSHFVPYANVDPRELTPSPTETCGGELVVAHAPTDRDVKGTAHVVAAVRQLQEEGAAVRLDLIEGVSHAELIRRARAADLVVDQLLLGWYGGFAVEAMALAKPVLCHIREERDGDNPFGAELPIVRATPQTLAERLRELLGDGEQRLRVGAASRRFVEHHHDPRTIARALLDGLVPLPGAATGPG